MSSRGGGFGKSRPRAADVTFNQMLAFLLSALLKMSTHQKRLSIRGPVSRQVPYSSRPIIALKTKAPAAGRRSPGDLLHRSPMEPRTSTGPLWGLGKHHNHVGLANMGSHIGITCSVCTAPEARLLEHMWGVQRHPWGSASLNCTVQGNIFP